MTATGTRPAGAGLLSVEQARDAVLAAIPGALAAEHLAPAAALGRVLAEPVVATVSLPPWDNAAMDGYAIVAADTAGATEAGPIRLEVRGEARAGSPATAAVGPGSAVRIATGAPLPAGARDAAGPIPAAVLVHLAVAAGGSVRRAGSDLSAGAEVLARGATLSPATIALTSGAGVAKVAAHRRPRVAVLATGDEVRAPGEPLGPAGIPDANRPALLAAVAAAGGEGIDLGIAGDELEIVLERLRGALADGVDAILVSGGVSVGPYDVVKAAFGAVGRIDLWRVAVQPGKPFAFGTAPRPGSGTALLFGLPGNPVSSVVTFELFVRPALRRLAGHGRILRPTDRAILREPVSKSHGRRAFLRVAVDRDAAGDPVRDERGRLAVRLAGGQGSHVLSALAGSDALAVVPESSDTLPAGAEVELWWLDPA